MYKYKKLLVIIFLIVFSTEVIHAKQNDSTTTKPEIVKLKKFFVVGYKIHSYTSEKELKRNIEYLIEKITTDGNISFFESREDDNLYFVTTNFTNNFKEVDLYIGLKFSNKNEFTNSYESIEIKPGNYLSVKPKSTSESDIENAWNIIRKNSDYIPVSEIEVYAMDENMEIIDATLYSKK